MGIHSKSVVKKGRGVGKVFLKSFVVILVLSTFEADVGSVVPIDANHAKLSVEFLLMYLLAAYTAPPSIQQL